VSGEIKHALEQGRLIECHDVFISVIDAEHKRRWKQPQRKAAVLLHKVQQLRSAKCEDLHRRETPGDLSTMPRAEQTLFAEEIAGCQIIDDSLAPAGQLHPTGTQKVHSVWGVVEIKQFRLGGKSDENGAAPPTRTSRAALIRTEC